MKKTKNYEVPALELFEVAVEQGFAATDGEGGIDNGNYDDVPDFGN